MFLLSTTIRILIFELPTVIITSEEEREMSKIPETRFTITKRPKKKRKDNTLIFVTYTYYLIYVRFIYKLHLLFIK